MKPKTGHVKTARRNARHERFAQLLASGLSQSEAYRKVYPKSRAWKPAVVHSKASELHGKVSVRVKELQADGASQAIATKNELAEFLTKIIRTPVANVDADHPLAQEVTNTSHMSKIRMPDKLGAAEKLARLMGYNEPDKTVEEIVFHPDASVLERLG